jgi:hypothetical protein
VDNGGAIVAPFIGPYCGGRRVVKRREAAVVELQ